MKTIVIGFILLLVGIVVYKKVTSYMQDKKEEKFEWLPTECAPEMYPMNIHEGYLLYEKSGGIYIPSSAKIKNGWGVLGSTHVVGEDMKPVPVKLSITWFSFLENKFYKGIFDLPKERMTQLFREGFIGYGKKRDTYSGIIVGMAPGGIAVVWMDGAGRCVEIGRYQAEETYVSMKQWVPEARVKEEDRDAWVKKYMSRDTLLVENFEKNGIPYGFWDICRQRFPMHPVVKFIEPEGNMVDEVDMYFYNGEKEYLALDELEKNAYIPRARIKKMDLVWFKGTILRESEIKFNEEEIFKAYEYVTQGDTSRKVDVVVYIDDNVNDRISLALYSPGEDENREYPLKWSRIRNFKDR